MENGSFVPERITLTYYDRDAKDFGVSWYTEMPGHPEIRYIRMPDGCFDAETADLSGAERIRCDVSKGMDGFKNTGIIPELPLETDYIYTVGDAEADVWSRRSVIRRRVPKNGEYTFLFMSDTQDSVNHGTMWKKAFSEALRDYPDAAFLIHGGDMVDYGGDAGLWRKMLSSVEEYTMRLPVLQASGNHEYWDCYLNGHSGIDAAHYHLDLVPQNTANGMYYSRRFGDSLFLILNSGDVVEEGAALSASQLEWIEKELERSNEKWRFVIIHNPLYSPGKYGSAPDRNREALNLRRQLNGLFEKYRVSLCMCAHDHVYSKTYPIDGEGKISENGVGTVHFMAGCAGIQNRAAIDDLSAEDAAVFEEYMPMRYGEAAYAALRVTPEKLDVFYYTVNCADAEAHGVLKSSFSIRPR